ncbi:MAG: polysaccharide biosynthesis/export family protein [Desulfuromonadales bacterium]|nr:polysaccharide biosynthesis/export family protein [Desulfuromonadales bacterium]
MNRHRFITIIFPLLLLVLWAAVAVGAGSDYQIGPGDVLKITLYDHPDLTTVARVDKDGYILFPLAGSVRVGGQSTASASQAIGAKLGADYIVNPQVSVFVQEFRSRVVYVTGQVNRPSAFTVEPDTTVIQAITMAGGFTPLAAQKKIKILRKINGVEKVFKKVPFHEKLMPEDVMVIPESFF